MSSYDLSISDLVARTGVTDPTLRVWERRYGFPEPQRTRSGHRRYCEAQVEAVHRVLALRQSGLSLPAAIARAQAPQDPHSISLFAWLRSGRPELEPQVMRKPALIALSHAIEDETLARAEAQVMFACFQRESFYRGARERWRELSATARVAAVFADFEQARAHDPGLAGAEDAGPAEVPISRRQQLSREWAIVAYGGRSSICMVARELAASNPGAASAARVFELLWTVEPDAVRALARSCAVLLGRWLPELAASAEDQLAIDHPASPLEQTRLTTAVMNRVLATMV